MRHAAAIWDMDGVIVNSGEFHFEAWRWLAEQRGQNLTREEFVPTFGMRNPDAILELFGEIQEAEALEMSLTKEAEFRRLLEGRVEALPGADRLIRALHQAGHRQAVASSSPLENIEIILRELSVAGCFQSVASGDEVSRGKPHPEIFTLAATRLGVAPIDCIVLEDAVVGVQAGIRAGMQVYAVTTTRAQEDLTHADRVVATLEELNPTDFLLP
ncbi:MAG: HAD family phosphatase [Chloroflexia bacterium]|nr:HAD family phosphatase [Chloroflexia bacterium]